VAKARQALVTFVAAYRTSQDWTNLLRRMAPNPASRFSVRRLSFGNQILVAAYGDLHVDSVGTFEAWPRVGRAVRKGREGALHSSAETLHAAPFAAGRERR
jgi:hypothetical protein